MYGIQDSIPHQSNGWEGDSHGENLSREGVFRRDYSSRGEVRGGFVGRGEISDLR